MLRPERGGSTSMGGRKRRATPVTVAGVSAGTGAPEVRRPPAWRDRDAMNLRKRVFTGGED